MMVHDRMLPLPRVEHDLGIGQGNQSLLVNIWFLVAEHSLGHFDKLLVQGYPSATPVAYFIISSWSASLACRIAICLP